MLSLLAIGTGLACLSFFIVWMISVKVKNYGFLDVAWSDAVAVLAPVYALGGPGDAWRKWLLTAVGALLNVRFGVRAAHAGHSEPPPSSVRPSTVSH